MALTDTFIRQVKHRGRQAGDKHADGAGLYLLVTASGKYWRLDYRHAGKRRRRSRRQSPGRRPSRRALPRGRAGR